METPPQQLGLSSSKLRRPNYRRLEPIKRPCPSPKPALNRCRPIGHHPQCLLTNSAVNPINPRTYDRNPDHHPSRCQYPVGSIPPVIYPFHVPSFWFVQPELTLLQRLQRSTRRRPLFSSCVWVVPQGRRRVTHLPLLDLDHSVYQVYHQYPFIDTADSDN